ncbi:MAG: leucyl aminopeptidase [Betaproteobacteria bacterium]|nr:leucyl aminopeptidase [Betaproteobacteria bacterium]
MEFSIKGGRPEKQRSAAMVLGVFESRKLTAPAEAVDEAADGYLTDILRHGDMEGRLGTTLLLHKVPNVAAERVLLVGLGKERDFRDKAYRDAIRAAIRALNDTGAADAAIHLTELPLKKRDSVWRTAQATLVTLETTYRFDRLKSGPDAPKRALRKLVFTVAQKSETAAAEEGLQRGLAVAQGVNLARDLGNLPANFCTPTYLAEQAQELARHYGFECTVLEQDEMRSLGMGALLSVTQGTVQPPKLIVLRHRGGGEQRPVVLVGKGITFDTGGISLKPAAEMDEMKFDMCGAASVLGTFKAIGELHLPVNLIGIIPSCENMPGGKATKPGDVVTSLSGQTIEILNTDAEGRLILCDALTYAERFDPEVVVDIATLTGACVIALGHVAHGLFANDDGLARDLLAASQNSYDRAWQMPLWDDYQEQLKTNFADMANVGGRPAGSVTAACFLSRFTKKYHWAHLDIAGTAWKSGKEKGATGRPVPLLTEFLVRRAGTTRE